MTSYSIGVDLGGTKVLVAIVNTKNGEVISSVKKKTKKDKGPEKITERLIEAIEELIEISSVHKKEIKSIGIGAAGQIDRKNGTIICAPNLDCYDLKLKEIIEKKFNIKTFMGNDVEVATIGELKFGAGKGCNNFVCVFVGTGIGSGIVYQGKLLLGATGTAGEIGHIVVDFAGRNCNCGAHGCLEAYASRTAIEKRIMGAIKKGRSSKLLDYIEENKPIRSGMIKKAIEQEDELAMQVIDEASEYLSCGLASVTNFLNPEMIILGGGLIDSVDYFYQKTIKKVKVKSLPLSSKYIKFKKAELGDYSGVIGAALLENYRKENK